MNTDELWSTLGTTFKVIIGILWTLLPFIVFIIKSRIESLQESIDKLRDEQGKSQQWLSAIYDELREMNITLSGPEPAPVEEPVEEKEETDDSVWAPPP